MSQNECPTCAEPFSSLDTTGEKLTYICKNNHNWTGYTLTTGLYTNKP